MSLFNFGKARAPHRKTTASMPPVRIAPPEAVTILMTQHIGADATPTVKVGDSVFVGTLVGEANGYVSANIHSSVSGTVKKLDYFLLPSGETTQSVIIESDGNMTPDPSLTPHTVTSFSELSDAARECGLVGLGGAGFPTSVKLNPEKIDKIDTLLLNGAECEPYITSDTRTMLDEADLIREGVLKITELSDIKRVVIGIEKNKPECIEKLREVFASEDFVEIRPLPSLYPQGAEKILIYNSLGRIIPEGKLPADIGVLVMNVTTVATLAKYLKTGMPLVEKCLTIDGSAIKSPAISAVILTVIITHIEDQIVLFFFSNSFAISCKSCSFF